jgi:uncharacterized delta-60 repeat protein
MRCVQRLLTLVIFLLFAASLQAAPGDLDTGFGAGGITTTAVGTGDGAHAVVQRADGKLVAAGYSYNGSNYDFALARYNTDGSLDTSFGTGGKTTTAIGSSHDSVFSMVQQTDSKLVLAGYSYNSSTSYNFALVRYNEDGSLDSSFGTGGIVTTAMSSSDDSSYSVIQQTDGKLVVAGYARVGSSYRFALARYNTDGSLDSSFGTGGKVITPVGVSYAFILSVIQQADGKLVATGYVHNGSNYDFGLVRYNTDGSLDTSFGVGGVVLTAVGTSQDYPFSVIQQADGKLVAAGYSHSGSNHDFALVRYNEDGSLDSSFGTGGKVTTAVGAGHDYIYSVIQQANGKLVAAGYSTNAGVDSFALALYNTDGSLDTDFGTGGIVITAVGSDGQAYSVIQQADGKLVAAGYATVGGSDSFALVRYESQVDTDTDGVFNDADNCPSVSNPTQTDTDGDGVGDACDAFPNDPTETTDDDGDGVGDNADNCPAITNADQQDTDGDGIGDVCDPDPTDPDVGVLIRKWGEFKKDNFGISVANAGDVNHDNIDDVVVGAYLWDKPILGRKKKLRSIGRVYVYSGRDGSELFSSTPLVGENRRDWFGYSVAGADINGDGYSDIIVGAPHWDVPKVGAQKALRNAGKVYVFNGQTGMLMASVQGTAADDNLGWSVSNAGDTDQDGSPDVVIGAPKADTTVSGKRQNNAGRALVCSGVVLAAAVDPNANACDVNTALFSVEGEVAGNGLGRTVAGAGDVDGDGHTDIVLGLPKADVSGKKNAGLAAVYSGATGAEWARAEGENAGDWFGYSVAGAGDLNGDSKADIVVGAYRYTATSITGKRMKQAGAVYRFTCVSAGTCSSIGQKTEGEAARDRLGWSVAAGGDVNNDGQLGVVAGAPGRDVTLPPVPPKTRGKRLKNVGAVYLLDGATGVSIHTPVLGVRAKDARGTCLASGGDVNGDGYSDIITAASKADTQKWIPNRNPTKPPKLKTIKNVGFVEVISGRTASGH